MNDNQLDAGQDSFLDIVANLVGILIILVVVVGAHAQSAWTAPATKAEEWQQVDELQRDVQDAAKQAYNRQLENIEQALRK